MSYTAVFRRNKDRIQESIVPVAFCAVFKIIAFTLLQHLLCSMLLLLLFLEWEIGIKGRISEGGMEGKTPACVGGGSHVFFSVYLTLGLSHSARYLEHSLTIILLY